MSAKILGSTLALLLFADAYCIAATKTPPLSDKAAQDKGPSVEVTMKFVRDKLDEQGKLHFVGQFVQGNTTYDTYNLFRPTEDLCVYSYKSFMGQDNWDSVRLSEVKKFTIVTLPAFYREDSDPDIAAKFPMLDVTPQIFVLKGKLPGSKLFGFAFTNEDDANRVAKALTHAVELCGGGNKDPF